MLVHQGAQPVAYSGEVYQQRGAEDCGVSKYVPCSRLPAVLTAFDMPISSVRRTFGFIHEVKLGQQFLAVRTECERTKSPFGHDAIGRGAGA